MVKGMALYLLIKTIIMKNIILIITLILLTSCSNDNDSVDVTLKVNHYKQTAIGVDKTLVLQIQENNNIGSDNWTFLHNEIEGFNYELGNVYEISAKKETISNPTTDGSSVKYVLIDIISKISVENGTTFELNLKNNLLNPPEYVYGNTQEGFTLLNEIKIDCNAACNELTSALTNENNLNGIFSHVNSETIKLESLVFLLKC